MENIKLWDYVNSQHSAGSKMRNEMAVWICSATEWVV